MRSTRLGVLGTIAIAFAAGCCLAAPARGGEAGGEAPREIARLLGELGGADAAARARAEEGLAAFGSEAIPALLEAMKGDPPVRLPVAAVLEEVAGGRKAPADAARELGGGRAVRRLWFYGRLPAESAPHKAAAAAVLGACGKPAVDALIESLGSSDEAVRGAAEAGLAAVGRDALPAVVKCLEHPRGPRLPVDALLGDENRASELEKFRGEPRAGPVLLFYLGLPREVAPHRAAAIRALSGCGAEAFGPVREALKDDDPEMRRAALAAVWRIEPHQDASEGLMFPLLLDPDEAVRGSAAGELRALHGQHKHQDRPLPAAALEPFKSDDVRVRMAAADLAGQHGPTGRAALDFLFKMLRAGEKEEREMAAWAISRVGLDDAHRGDVSALVDALAGAADDSPVCETVRALGPQSARTTEALVKALEKGDADMRRAAARMLAQFARAADEARSWARSDPERGAPAAPQSLERLRAAAPVVRKAMLGDPDDAVRTDAVAAFVVISGGDDVEAVFRLVSDRSPEVRRAAVKALGSWHCHQEGTLPVLIAALKDEDAGVRRAAAYDLGYWYEGAGAAGARALGGALGDGDREVSLEAIEALSRIGVWAAGAIGDIAGLAEGADDELAGKACEVIVSLGPRAAGAVPALVRELQRAEAGRRARAARVLGRLGPAAKDALGPLITAARDRDEAAASAAVVALGTVGPGSQACAQLVARLAEDGRKDVRCAAIRTAGSFGAESKPMVPALLKLLADDDKEVRSAALEGLARAVPVAEDRAAIVRELAVRLDGKPEDGDAAAQAIQDMGRFAVEGLAAALADPRGSAQRRARILNLLTEIPGAAEALPAVRPLLSDPDKDVRAAAVSVWLKAGPRDDECRAVLVKALEDGEPVVVYRAARRLDQLSCFSDAAAPHLVSALKRAGTDKACREILKHAMYSATPRSEEAAAVVAADLDAEDWRERYWTLELLARMGPALKGQLPRLAAAMEDKNGSVAWKAAEAVACAGPEGVPVLLAALEKSQGDRRRFAVDALRLMKQAAGPALKRLREAMADPDPRVRVAAAKAVWEVSGEAGESLPVVLKALRGKDKDAAEDAAGALEAMGPAARPILKELIGLLESGSPFEQESAIKVLSKCGRESAPAVPLLVARLGCRQYGDPDAVGRALYNIGADAVPALLKAVETADPERRRSALAALSSIGPESEAVVALFIRLLGDGDRDIRKAAADALGPYCDLTAAAVPALHRALGDSSAAVRAAAASSLVEAGFRVKGASGPLVAALADPDVGVRKAAAYSLRNLWPEESPADEVAAAVAGLRPLLADLDPEVRKNAADTLARYESRAAAAVPELRKALADEKDEVRRAAIWALGEIGPKTAEAVPDLLRILRQGAPEEREASAWALGMSGRRDPEVEAALRSALADLATGVRCRAAWSIWKLTGVSGPSVAVLVKVLESRDHGDGYDAIHSLAWMGESADPVAVAALVLCLKDYNAEQVADGLARYGPAARAAVPALEKILAAGKDASGCRAAAKALFNITGDARRPVEALVAMLTAEDTYDRSAAAWALKELGPAAAAAVPALEKAAADYRWSVRFAAREALEKIRGGK